MRGMYIKLERGHEEMKRDLNGRERINEYTCDDQYCLLDKIQNHQRGKPWGEAAKDFLD